MIRFTIYAALAAVMVLLTGGMSGQVSVAAEDQQAFPDPGHRVVCVSKQINEFIYAIGAENRLVGRDLTSVYPPKITALPSVGYHRALSAEGILSLRPSLFLTDGNLGPAEVADRLRSVNMPILNLPPDNTMDGARKLMSDLGTLFHREAAAQAVLASWSKGMDEVLATTAAAHHDKHPRVLMIHFGQVGNSYLAVGGKDGPADQVLGWAGGENAKVDVKGTSRLTPELIAQAAPDVILATDVGFDRYGSAEKFKELPGVALTPAGQNGRIYRIDESEIMYFGPRTPAAVRHIAKLLFP